MVNIADIHLHQPHRMVAVTTDRGHRQHQQNLPLLQQRRRAEYKRKNTSLIPRTQLPLQFNLHQQLLVVFAHHDLAARVAVYFYFYFNNFLLATIWSTPASMADNLFAPTGHEEFPC